MADSFNKDQRSEIMRKVKSNRNKSTELKLISIFKKNRISGWRRNYKIYGKPDFVFLKCKIAIFVDGCFWHGHECRNTKPKDNEDYWTKKIARNKARDIDVTNVLTAKKWIVIRFWECELKNESYILQKILALLPQASDSYPII